MSNQIKTAIKLGITVIIALISFFALSKQLSDQKLFSEQMEYLDQKRVAVTELAGASTAASLAISALPGDLATPIAEKLADLSGYFLLIIGAIFLEKYLLTITVYFTFRVIIPIALLFLIIYIVSKEQFFCELTKKFVAFGIVISLLIPSSLNVSQLIEDTYRNSADNSIDAAIQMTQEMNSDSEETGEEQSTENMNWWGKLWNNAKKSTEGVAKIPSKLTEVLNNFVEAVAVLIVTSCVIPLLILLAFLWIVKLYFSVDVTQLAATAIKKRNPESD